MAAAAVASVLAGYDDSESDDENKSKEEIKAEEPAPAEQESDSESSSDDDGRKKLTSASNLFNSVTEKDLAFKAFAKQEKMKKIAKKAEEDLTWRVTAASAETLAGTGGSVPAIAEGAGTKSTEGESSPLQGKFKLGHATQSVTADSLSTLGGETNLTKLYSEHPGVQQLCERASLGASGRLNYAMSMQKQGHRADAIEKRKASDTDGMTTKERTKLKRAKGQSGEDHNGRTWKPEAMMQMRQDYD